jgi:hypothetical protein
MDDHAPYVIIARNDSNTFKYVALDTLDEANRRQLPRQVRCRFVRVRRDLDDSYLRSQSSSGFIITASPGCLMRQVTSCIKLPLALGRLMERFWRRSPGTRNSGCRCPVSFTFWMLQLWPIRETYDVMKQKTRTRCPEDVTKTTLRCLVAIAA